MFATSYSNPVRFTSSAQFRGAYLEDGNDHRGSAIVCLTQCYVNTSVFSFGVPMPRQPFNNPANVVRVGPYSFPQLQGFANVNTNTINSPFVDAGRIHIQQMITTDSVPSILQNDLSH